MLFQRFSAFLLASLAGLGLGASVASAGTELRLRNGDHLSGELIKREDGKIFFKSPILGEITLPQSEAVLVEVPDTPVESLVGLPPSGNETRAAQPPTENSRAPAGGPSKLAAKPKPSRWQGKIEFGYQQQAGRRETLNTTLRADAERKNGPDSLKGSGRMLYGQQNDKISSERYDASFRWRHEFSRHVFGQSLTSYNSDRVKDIDLNFEQNASLGLRVIQRPRHSASVGIGMTAQQRKADGIKDDPIALGEVFQDYTYRFNGHLSFLQESSAVYSNKSVINDGVDVSNYRIRFNTALQGKVTERVSLNLRYEYEWDNTAPNIDEKQDQRITSSIGYSL